MDSVAGDELRTLPVLHNYASDFGLVDFTDFPNFDQLIVELIRGDQVDQPYDQTFNSSNDNIVQGYNYYDRQDYNINNLDSVALFNHDDDDDVDGVIDHGIDESSSATTADRQKTTKKGKVDHHRSRTLVSERKRRGRMKETLYALRSLVPNITKMDKASIIGDAVLYVQDLQRQARRLEAEIACLQSSNVLTTPQNDLTTSFYPMTNKIYKMDVFQVEERGFYVRIVSNKGKGVCVSLFKALEALTKVNVQASNLMATVDNYVLTFTLHIIEEGVDMNLDKVQVLIGSVFHSHGFEATYFL